MRCLRFPLLLAAAAPVAHATTWTVDSDQDFNPGVASHCTAGSTDPCTLRDAIAAATGGDFIVFDTSVATITATGQFILSDDSAGLVTIEGAGKVTLDGNHATRLLYANANTITRIDGLVMRNGFAPMDPFTAGKGGAIYNGGILTLSDCVVSGNASTYNGGAIWNSGPLTLIDSTVSDNSAANAGGAIANFSALTLVGSVLSGNTAPAGGGIYNNSRLTLSRTTLSGNAATQWQGGGILNRAALTVDSSTLSNNTAGTSGGGLFNNGALTLVNSTLSGNHATNGGGISSLNIGAATVINSTFAGNSANQGGDMDNQNILDVTNTIFADGCAGGLTDHGGNLDAGTSCGLDTAHSNANLELGPLQDNGGSTQTRLPGVGSDVIGAGVGSACNAAPVNGLDQRGQARMQGPACDSGAVEVLSDRVFADGFEQAAALRIVR